MTSTFDRYAGDVDALGAAARSLGFDEGPGLRAALVADGAGRTACHVAAARGKVDVLRALARGWRRAARDEYDAVSTLTSR